MELPLWAYGVLGGCSAEVLRWFRLRDQLHQGMPHFSKSVAYWVVTALMIAIGGFLVQMYVDSGSVMLNGPAAFNIGISAPLLLSALSSQAPVLDPGQID